MTWDKMVKLYPDKWVAVKDAVMNRADIVSGEVVAVLSDAEMRKFRLNHQQEGLLFRRTTEGRYTGPIISNKSIRIN